MAKMRIKCLECPNEFWTTKIKVYVLKIRKCKDCNVDCTVSDDMKLFTCPKCGHIVKKNEIEYGGMGVEMRGTLRTFDGVEKIRAKDKTIEVEPVFVPENQFCQGCRNFMGQRDAMMKNRMLKEKKGDIGGRIREVTKEEGINAIRREINRLHKKEFQERTQKEQEEIIKKRKEELVMKAKEEGKT